MKLDIGRMFRKTLQSDEEKLLCGAHPACSIKVSTRSNRLSSCTVATHNKEAILPCSCSVRVNRSITFTFQIHRSPFVSHRTFLLPLPFSWQLLWLTVHPSPLSFVFGHRLRSRIYVADTSPLIKPWIFWVELEHVFAAHSIQLVVLKRVPLQPAKSRCTFTVNDCTFVREDIAERIKVHSTCICRSSLAVPKLLPWAPASFSYLSHWLQQVRKVLRQKTRRIVADPNSVRSSSVIRLGKRTQHHSHVPRTLSISTCARLSPTFKLNQRVLADHALLEFRLRAVPR